MDWRTPEIERIVLAAVELDERVWETYESAEIVSKLTPMLRDLANLAISMLDQLLAEFDGNRGNCATDWSALADVAFMARWDLRRRLGNLPATSHGKDRWMLLAACSSLRRRVAKSLCEVERVRCSILNIRNQFDGYYRNDLNVAIATRRAYRAFMASVRSISTKLEAGEHELGKALRLGAAAFAVLIGQSIYPDLRIEDREQIRGLQARLFAAVRSDDPFSQRRVWSDIEAFAELLAGVQARPELVAHDYELICETLARLEALQDGEALEAGSMARLAALEGRDPNLDALQAEFAVAPERATVELGPALLELAATLGRKLGRQDHERRETEANQAPAVQTAAN